MAKEIKVEDRHNRVLKANEVFEVRRGVGIQGTIKTFTGDAGLFVVFYNKDGAELFRRWDVKTLGGCNTPWRFNLEGAAIYEKTTQADERKYILWSPGSSFPPRVVMSTLATAQEVAESMARRHQSIFYVCELIEKYTGKAVTTVEVSVEAA